MFSAVLKLSTQRPAVIYNQLLLKMHRLELYQSWSVSAPAQPHIRQFANVNPNVISKPFFVTKYPPLHFFNWQQRKHLQLLYIVLSSSYK